MFRVVQWINHGWVCCWHQLPSALSRRTGWPGGRNPSNPRSDNTRVGWYQQHTHPSIINPDCNMIITIVMLICPISCLLIANQSLNQEQSHSALPCHYIILVASIVVAPHGVPRLLRETGRVNRTAPHSGRHLLDNNVVDHVVCLKAEFLSRTAISNKNGEFCTTIISVLEQVGMSVNGTA